MRQDERVKEILELIDQLFGDTSCPQEKTLAMMEEIQEAVDSNVCALKDDIKRQAGHDI